MVKVPEYDPNVSLRPINRQGVDVQASGESFGAALGRGLSDLAKGTDNLGDSLNRVQQLDDTMRAKDAENKFGEWTRNRMFGEGGFMMLEGRSAVDGRDAFEREAAEKRKEFGTGLTPGAARAYDVASQARLQTTYQQSIVHSAQARKKWFGDASSARIEGFANDALVNFDKPEMVTKNIAAGILELRESGTMHGWDADTQKQREQQYVSGVYKNITLRMAQSDPIAAEKFFKEKTDLILGSDRYDLDKTLKVPLKEAQSQRAAAEFISQSAKSSGSMTAADMLRRFEGFKSSTYWDVNHHRVGFGSDTITREDGTVETVQQGMTVTPADAERDLQRRIFITQGKISNTVGVDKWDALSAPAKAAVTSVAYNYGTLPESVTNAIRTGGPAEIAAAIRGLAGHNDGVNSKRRNQEADAVVGVDMSAAGKGAESYFTNLETYLSTIKDPEVQDLTRKRINAMLETQHKATTERERAAKATLWQYIDKNMTPDQVPMEVRTAAGMAAVSSAWSYLETVRKGRDIQSDDEMVYGLRRTAAQDPEFFSKIDLNDYRGKLSKADIKELTGLQTSALTDQKKAREEGLQITTAFSQATQQLEAVGITATGKKGSQLEAVNKRIAQFNNALSTQMDEFKRQNDNRAPSQMDIQSMINRLLLPVVIKTPGVLWNSTDTSKRLFEAPLRADGATVDVAVKYGDIPIDLRRGIATDLQRELGRKPSEEEVTQRYEDFILKQ